MGRLAEREAEVNPVSGITVVGAGQTAARLTQRRGVDRIRRPVRVGVGASLPEVTGASAVSGIRPDGRSVGSAPICWIALEMTTPPGSGGRLSDGATHTSDAECSAGPARPSSDR